MSTTTAKQAQKKQAPVKVIRVGAIAASIWRRQTSTGLEYLDFSLSRSWKLKNGEREGYSQNFFDKNEDALLEVVHQACRYIHDERTDSEDGEFNRNVVVGNESAHVAA